MKHYAFFSLLTQAPGFALMALSLTQISLNGPFTYLRFGPVVSHAWSAFVFGFTYTVSSEALMFLPIPIRSLYAVALMVAGIHLYDSLWGLGSVFSGNGGYPVVPLISLIATMVLLVWLDSRNTYLKARRVALIPLFATIVLIGAMAFTGFYAEMSLYNAGVGVDPNVGNIWWMLSKFSGLMVFPLLTRSGRESKEVRWQL